MTIRAGNLTETMEVQTYAQADDGRGGFVDSWSTDFEMRMQMMPLAGLERPRESQLQVVASHKFRGWWRSGVTTKKRLRHKLEGRVFDIQEVLNVGNRGREMIVLAVERLAA